MTLKELSNSFDVLLNSYGTEPNITLNEYEKSVFLTQAQEQIVIELYTGRTNKYSSFEATEELRASLNNLMRTVMISRLGDDAPRGLSEYSKFVLLPSDVLFITYESIEIDDERAGCKNGKNIPVIPITQDEYSRVIENPFRGPGKRKAVRLDYGIQLRGSENSPQYKLDLDNPKRLVEIISKYDFIDYTIKYISRPSPIILHHSDNVGQSIDGINNLTECRVDSSLHRYILDRAVALAIASRSVQRN